MEWLAARLARVPGVIAVTLGGSRAQGTHRPESDWDFGLYYRGSIDVGVIRALGYEGEVVDPGRWGRLMNGGAWFTIDGTRVDVLYRDLDTVEGWVAAAEGGAFEIDAVPGYLAGMATYILAGELGVARVLTGDLPRPRFPAALREAAPIQWRGRAAFALVQAETFARRESALQCLGMIANAAVCEAQARVAAAGEWALNEKGILARADLADVDMITRNGDLLECCDLARQLLDIPPPDGLRLDTPGR